MSGIFYLNLKNKIIKNIVILNDVFNDFRFIRLYVNTVFELKKQHFKQSSYNIIKAPMSVVIPAVTTISVFVTGNKGRAGVMVMV